MAPDLRLQLTKCDISLLHMKKINCFWLEQTILPQGRCKHFWRSILSQDLVMNKCKVYNCKQFSQDLL